jgi:high-affinity nickel-transport protein
MTITFVSVIVALLVGGIEALGLVGERMHATGGFWSAVAALNRNFGSIGYLIIAVFIASWVLAAAIYRLKRYDALEVGKPAG